MLGIGNGADLDFLFIHQLASFLVGDELEGLGDLELAGAATVLAQLAEHATQLVGHFLHALGAHDLDLRAGIGHVDLDLLVVQLAFAQLFAKHLARGVVGSGLRPSRCAGLRNQHVQNALLGRVFGAGAHLLHLGFTRLLDGHLGQVADDGVHVLAHIAHFGELGGLDLDEGSIGQLGQAAGDLGLAHARGANHEDVLRGDLVAQAAFDLLAAPAVAQRDGHSALGAGLAHDVVVQLGDDFLGGHGRHGVSLNSIKNGASAYQ